MYESACQSRLVTGYPVSGEPAKVVEIAAAHACTQSLFSMESTAEAGWSPVRWAGAEVRLVGSRISSCADGGTPVRWPRSLPSDMRRIRRARVQGGPVQAA